MRTLSGLLFFAAAALAGDGAINASERAYLLEVLASTDKAFLSSIEGLTDAQWRFKPAPDVWSVQECAEHIVIAEDLIRGLALKIAQTPAVPRPAGSNPENDRKLFEAAQDRTKKGKAPEILHPTGKFPTPADATREFAARREKTIDYVKTTNDELRTRVSRTQAGMEDAYQFLIRLAGHCARHTAQLREVQAHAAYPKASK